MDFLSSEFWSNEKDTISNILEGMFLRILKTGFEDGASMLGSLGISTTWEIFNEAVVNYGRNQAEVFATYLAESIANELAIRIPNWIESGSPLQDLISELGSLYNPVRAEMIAITEVTRLYAVGNINAWNASGVVQGKMWRTVGDERVCPICGNIEKDTPVVPLNATSFEFRDKDPESQTYGQVLQIFHNPPAHVRCRCVLRPVVTP